MSSLSDFCCALRSLEAYFHETAADDSPTPANRQPPDGSSVRNRSMSVRRRARRPDQATALATRSGWRAMTPT